MGRCEINSSNKQSGFGMVEALMAILVLSIGLLGLATLQTQGLRNTNSAYFRTQANMMAASMLDSMRANVTAARAGSYNLYMHETPTGNNVANKSLISWVNRIGKALPSGDGAISCDASSCAVAIRWDDSLGGGNSMHGRVDFDNDGINDNIADTALGELSPTDRNILVLRTRI